MVGMLYFCGVGLMKEMYTMKKILTVSAALFIALSSIAQEHLSFMGIPIEGSMKSFCEQLADKGFENIGNEGSVAMFTGVFTGREAYVGVDSDDTGNNVYSVAVAFEPSHEWRVLVDTYNYYKDLYTRKYGEPKSTIEQNKAIQSDGSNGQLMAEVNDRKATWCSLRRCIHLLSRRSKRGSQDTEILGGYLSQVGRL